MKVFMKTFFTVILIIAVSLQSCKKDNPGVAPELPAEASFTTDFSDFNDNSKLLFDGTSVNWKHAAGNVFVWNVIIYVGLAVPVASYAEAVKNHPAEYQGDNVWLWQYSFIDKQNNTYNAKLYGTLSADAVDWEMYISKEGSYTDFKWYTGKSLLDKSKVNWTLYESPTKQNELLSIEWNKTSDTTANIKYMNIKPGATENGGYIKYGNGGGEDYNAYYLIYNKGQDNLIEINWDQTNKNGRVKDQKKFGDTDWHCWNTVLEDITCN